MSNDRKAQTCEYVYEGGRHYLVIVFGKDKDDWIRVELNKSQVRSFMHRAFDRVVPR